MRRPVRGLLLTLLACCAWSAQGTAQTSDTLIVPIPGVLVRGARPAVTGGSGVVTAKLDSLPLAAVPTIEQVLRSLPGTYLRTNSRGESEVTVRGSESRQVAILLDGAPLTFAWDGRADVSVVPALAVEEVTLVRGLSSLTQGPNTLGGVVELHTRMSAGARPGARFRAGVDELGGYGVVGSIGAPRDLGWGVFTVRAGAGHRDTPGQTLPHGIEEPVPTDSDTRLNTDLEETNGFVSMRVDSDHGAYLSLLGIGQRAERGIAAQLGVTGARFWRYPFIARGIGVLSGGTGVHRMPWGGEADLHVSGGYDRGRTEIDAFDSPDYSTLDSEEDGNDEVVTLRTTASQSLGESAKLRLGFTQGSVQHDEILNGVLNAYRQRLWSGSAQTEIRLPGAGPVRGFDVTAGGTWDGSETPESGNKPPYESLDHWGGRIGLAAHVGPGATSIHASVSQRARFPSLRELYSGSLGTLDPNPKLKPEHLTAIEAGVTSRTPVAALQLVAFHHRLSDAVVRIRPPGQNFQRVNQEGIRSVGVEALASRAIGVFEVSADVIVQDVEVLDPDAGLTRPENMPEIMGGLRFQAPVGLGTQVAVDARYTGEQFVIDPENDVESKLAQAGRVNVELFRSWAIGDTSDWFRSVQLRAAADNLTDTVQYDAFGLPRPGRTVRMEVRVN